MHAFELLTTFTSGTEIALKLVTTGVLAFGAAAGVWKFVLQGAIGNNYDFELSPCQVRALTRNGAQEWAYTLCLSVRNKSSAIQHMKRWWRRIRFSDEVPANYDPDGELRFDNEGEAIEYFGKRSRLDDYPLMPGEAYADRMLVYRKDGDQRICYVEFTLGYRCWRRKCGVLPYRDWQFYSQIMIAPIEAGNLN